MRGRKGRKHFKEVSEAHAKNNRLQLLSLARGPNQNPETLERVRTANQARLNESTSASRSSGNQTNVDSMTSAEAENDDTNGATNPSDGDGKEAYIRKRQVSEIQICEPMKIKLVKGLPDGSYAFFRTKYRVPPTASITVTVEPITGDPDLFISTICTRPTHDNNEWKSSGDGSDTIHIPPSDPPRDRSVFYYIAVLAYGAKSTFRLDYSVQYGNVNPWVDEEIWRTQLLHVAVDQHTSVLSTIDPLTGFTPALIACAEGSRTALTSLLSLKADLSYQAPFEGAPTPAWLSLTTAQTGGDAQYEEQATPVLCGDTALTACVGMDLWGSDARGWRYRARMEVLEVLLDRMPMVADVEDLESGQLRVPPMWKPRKVDGCTALHLAAASGNVEVRRCCVCGLSFGSPFFYCVYLSKDMNDG